MTDRASFYYGVIGPFTATFLNSLFFLAGGGGERQRDRERERAIYIINRVINKVDARKRVSLDGLASLW